MTDFYSETCSYLMHLRCFFAQITLFLELKEIMAHIFVGLKEPKAHNYVGLKELLAYIYVELKDE